MEPTRERISERQQDAILSFSAVLPQQGTTKPSEIQRLISKYRASFHIAQSVSNKDILQLLLREGIIKEAVLDFPVVGEQRCQMRISRRFLRVHPPILSGKRALAMCRRRPEIGCVVDSPARVLRIEDKSSPLEIAGELLQGRAGKR